MLQPVGKNEEEEFNTGPLSVLMMSVKNNTQVCLTSCFLLYIYHICCVLSYRTYLICCFTLKNYSGTHKLS